MQKNKFKELKEGQEGWSIMGAGGGRKSEREGRAKPHAASQVLIRRLDLTECSILFPGCVYVKIPNKNFTTLTILKSIVQWH